MSKVRSGLIALSLAASAVPQAAIAGPVTTAVAQPAPAPAPKATNAAPVYGDLTHLEFTATGPLHATLVSPAPDGASDVQSAQFDVATGAGGGVELGVDGKTIDATHIGKRTVDTKTGETHYVYYGVPLAEGPTDVTLVPLGAGGARGTAVHATVYGPGRPVRVEAKLGGDLRADGQSTGVLVVTGFDRWNHPALPGSAVRVAIVRGDARFAARKRTAMGLDAAGEVPLPAGAPANDLLAQPIAPGPLPTATFAPRPADATDQSDLTRAPQPAQGENWRAVGDTNAPLQSIDVLLGRGGTVSVAIVPGLRSGDLIVRATFGDVASDVRAFIAPALRKPMVVGLATAGVGSVPGVPGEQVNVPNGANSRRGRIALYGVGQITKTAQATIAYDTADTLEEVNAYGSFTDNPNARPYLTFGDASQRRNDALSRDHLYARVDSGRSSATWGEFQADTGGTNGIGGFSQLVAGAKVEVAGNAAKAMAFQARNDIAYSRQIFSPTGLATVGSLLHSQIVVGSDTITLVALDRRTGAILTQQVLTRNVDYTLDYSSGYLRFLNPPLPFDNYFNPQQLVVQYEYGGRNVNAETTGGRAETTFGKTGAVRLGVGYVNDATGSGNLSLFGQDLGGTLPGGSWAVGHLGSHGSAQLGNANPQLGAAGGASGDAYRFSLATALGNNKVDLGFESTSQGFNNPFGGLTTPGLLDYRAAYTRTFGKDGSVVASFDHEQNNLAGSVNSQSQAAVRARVPLSSRFVATAGVALRSSSAFAQAPAAAVAAGSNAVANQQVGTTTPPAAVVPVSNYTANGSGSAQAQLGFEYKVNDVVKIAANRVSNIGNNTNASQPAQTSAEIDADISKRGRVFVRQLWSDQPTTSFAAATATLTGSAGAKSSTAVGVERAIGNNTNVDSEYVVDKTASGSDVYAQMGVREKLAIGKNLRGEASLQRAVAFGNTGTSTVAASPAGPATTAVSEAQGYNIYGLSLAYAIARFHASTQYQLRTGNGRGYTFDVAAAGALSPDFSAFVASNASSSGTGFNNVDSKASVAFRPSLDDRSVTLFSYERQDGNITSLGTHAEVLSLEELVRPTRLTEIAARYAYKLDGDAYYPARSSLFGARLDQRLGSHFDVAAEVRYLSAHNIDNANTTGFAVEAGYRIGNEMRVAAGYNFTGSPDPSLVAAPTRRGVYGTVTSVIDSIFGWGAQHQ